MRAQLSFPLVTVMCGLLGACAGDDASAVGGVEFVTPVTAVADALVTREDVAHGPDGHPPSHDAPPIPDHVMGADAPKPPDHGPSTDHVSPHDSPHGTDAHPPPDDGPCIPACDGKECGPNGCGGKCGACPAAAPLCVEGLCKTVCTPSCDGKECGSNGCGGKCGSCPAAAPLCEAGKCYPKCAPKCSGKECGPDGCGGQCGSCLEPSKCTDLGKCEGSGSCVNTGDVAILSVALGDVNAALAQCGSECWVSKDCLKPCISESTGLSGKCSACYASLVVCSVEHCLEPCGNDPGGLGCTYCQKANGCLGEFGKCSGLPTQ